MNIMFMLLNSSSPTVRPSISGRTSPSSCSRPISDRNWSVRALIQRRIGLSERAVRLLCGNRHCLAPHLLAEIVQRVLDVDADQRVYGVADIGRRTADYAAPGVQNLVHFHRDDRHEDVALVPIVIVDRADRDFGLRRDRLDLGAFITGFAEQLCGRIEDTTVPVRSVLGAQPAHAPLFDTNDELTQFWNWFSFFATSAKGREELAMSTIPQSVWKKAAAAAAAGVLLVVNAGLLAAQELNALIWCDHADPALLQPFEEANGVKVNVKEFEGTGAGLAIVEQSQPGDWDVMVIDSIDVPRGVEKGLFEPLPEDKLPFADLFPEVRMDGSTVVDGKRYGITEKFGYNTISFNNTKVDPADMQSLASLTGDKYKGRIAIYDYYLPVIGMAALAIGKKTSELTEADLPAIKDVLLKMKANAKLVGEIVASQTALATGEVDVIVGGGEFVTAGPGQGESRHGFHNPQGRSGSVVAISCDVQGFQEQGPRIEVHPVHPEPRRAGTAGDIILLLGDAGERQGRAHR